MKIYKDFVLSSQVDLNTMTNVQCSSPPILWKPRTQITDNMICASDAGKSACLGDTGGPLVTNEGKYYSVIGRNIFTWILLDRLFCRCCLLGHLCLRRGQLPQRVRPRHKSAALDQEAHQRHYLS